MRHSFLTAAAILGLALHPAQAQNRLAPPAPVCGEFEHVQVEGGVEARLITENCVAADQAINGGSRTGATGWGAGAAGLAALALALALAGGGSSSDDDAPATPPRRPRPPDLPPPPNASDPAAWRGPEFNRQYGLGLIGVEHRYAQGATGQDTLGAIYDSGIDLDHYDVGGIRFDLSHSYAGVPDNLGDRDGHGTHVYGIAGARRNGEGIHGVAPDAQFMILRSAAIDFPDVYTEFDDALRRVVAARADAMNNSWAIVISEPMTGESRALLTSDFASVGELRTELGNDLVQRLLATGPAGVSVIFATGNDGATDSSFLAGLPHFLPELEENWIAVTALDDVRSLTTARIADYANRCGMAMNWCLAAPGTNILSPGAAGAAGTGRGGLAVGSGTSMAAPHVFGAVLVLKSQFPELTTPEVHTILFDTAVDLGARGTDPVYGRGALNLNEALAPQGTLMVELGDRIAQNAVPLAQSWIAGSAVTGGVLAEALAGRAALVTDRYDRGYFAGLGQRVATVPDGIPSGAHTRLAVAMALLPDARAARTTVPVDLRFDTYGPDHDVTRVAHADPVMTLAASDGGTGFSARMTAGDLTLTMAGSQGTRTSALALGADRSFGKGHRIGLVFGRLDENNGLLGATGHGAFGTLEANTVYGRVEADLATGARATVNASLTAAATEFGSGGLLSGGRMNSLALSFGMTRRGVFSHGDRLSLAVARPFSVAGGDVTIRSGAAISPARAGRRTNRVQFADTRVPLGDADRAPELHIGYTHRFGAGRLGTVALAAGAIATLSGGPDLTAARVGLAFRF